jgi:hypothetical protein
MYARTEPPHYQRRLAADGKYYKTRNRPLSAPTPMNPFAPPLPMPSTTSEGSARAARGFSVKYSSNSGRMCNQCMPERRRHTTNAAWRQMANTIKLGTDPFPFPIPFEYLEQLSDNIWLCGGRFPTRFLSSLTTKFLTLYHPALSQTKSGLPLLCRYKRTIRAPRLCSGP